MNATIAARSPSSIAGNAGIPASARPVRTSGPIRSPRTSAATVSERVKSAPPEPPVASGPWQNPQVAANRVRPAATTSAVYDCGVSEAGTGRAAGLSSLRGGCASAAFGPQSSAAAAKRTARQSGEGCMAPRVNMALSIASTRAIMTAMKRWLVRGAAFCACFGALVARAAEPIPVLILDGESGGPYHDWPRVTTVLERVLGEVGLFEVSIATAQAGGDFTKFAPNFQAFRVVVLNYDAPDERWP